MNEGMIRKGIIATKRFHISFTVFRQSLYPAYYARMYPLQKRMHQRVSVLVAGGLPVPGLLRIIDWWHSGEVVRR